jgi:hypothetical protein
MKITGSEHIQADNILLRPIAEQDAGLIVAASVSDVPDWTFVPRNLEEEGARAWIRKGVAARESGQAVRFVIETEGRPGPSVYSIRTPMFAASSRPSISCFRNSAIVAWQPPA